MLRRRRAASERSTDQPSASAGVEEFVEVEFEDVVSRTAAHMNDLIERARADIERELGEFVINADEGQITLDVDGEPRYRASTTSGGRLLLTDVSGRFERHL